MLAEPEPLHQLVGDVVIFGEELSGDVEGDRIRAVLGDCPGEFAGDKVERLVPSGVHAADFRIKQSAIQSHRLAKCGTLGAELAEIGGMVGVPADGNSSIRGNLGQHAATHPAIGAGGPHLGCLLFHDCDYSAASSISPRPSAMRPASILTEMVSNQIMMLLRGFGELGHGHWLEFMLVLAGHAFRPRIDLRELLAEDEALEIASAPVEIVEHLPLDLGHADALGPFVDALEIARLLAVHLRQRDDHLERFVLGLHAPQDLRAIDVETGSTSEVDLVSGIHADHADILAGGFRAVARAAGHSHLDLRNRQTHPFDTVQTA